ncbi:MAG TPA: GGDEF domain-containing protein [Roseiarcus sp.]|nr:GGDEF domain-containing protein [Roseiarcus sp.]
MLIRFFDNVFRPKVADRKDLQRYVASVVAFAWIVAMTAEIVNKLCFFSGWGDFWREFAITTVEVLALAISLAWSIGRVHLQLGLAKREADRLGRVDPMTGLANRRAFYEAADSFAGGAVALAIVDIDRFKRINDSNGHATGDNVLKAVATFMQAQLGDLGLVARIGGEEFALISAELSAAELRERLLAFSRRLAAASTPGPHGAIHVTVSIGFACRGDIGLDSLYAAADKALYFAKSAGRDRIVDFDEIGDAVGAARLCAG